MKPDKAFFQNLAERVIAEMPLEDRFTEADAAEMARHKDFLLSLEEDMTGQSRALMERSVEVAVMEWHG